MKTYDNGASTHGADPFWRAFPRLVRRWVDRERELVSLRNSVGMMAEARRADSREYHDMVDALRRSSAQIKTLEGSVTALTARLTHVEASQAHHPAARVLADFAKTAPGRLPQRVQEAVEAALSDGVAMPDPSACAQPSPGERG